MHNNGALSVEDFREGWKMQSKTDSGKSLTDKMISLVGNAEDGGNVLL